VTSAISTGKSVCKKYCKYGEYLDTVEWTCKACFKNCLICSSSETCYACINPYVLKNDEKCEVSTGEENYKTVFNTAMSHLANIIFDLYFKDYENEEVCLKGYTKMNSKCQKCSYGCLACISTSICIICDTNFKLGANKMCTAIESILKISNKVNQNVNDCSLCFQSKSIKSTGCSECSTECKCSLGQYINNNSYLFKCWNTTFDGDYIRTARTEKEFEYSQPIADSSFVISSKSTATQFTYLIDPQIILKTTNCFINISRQYSVLKRVVDSKERENKKNSQSKETTLSVGSDVIILALGLLSGPIGNLIMGFLQFNKIFLFLSLPEMEGGQFYQFINVNLYQSKKRAEDFM
jgi:hypothetical protein